MIFLQQATNKIQQVILLNLDYCHEKIVQFISAIFDLIKIFYQEIFINIKELE